MKFAALPLASLAAAFLLCLTGCSTTRPEAAADYTSASPGTVQPSSAPVSGTYWANWRGPLRTGESPDARPPVSFSDHENLKWKVAVPGRGSSSPIIWGQKVFLTSAIPVGSDDLRQFVVLCLARGTGQELWRRVVREQRPIAGHHRDHDYASGSAVTDGEVLIAHFGSYGTYGLDLDGRVLWENDLGDMRTRNDFGEGSSPALADDTVIIVWDHEGPDFIVALDKRTGKERWRQDRDEPTSWATPLVVEHQGRKIVVANGSNRVRAYDFVTGELLWQSAGQTVNVIPSPVTADGVVYATSGFRGSALQAIELGRRGEITPENGLRWSRNRNTPYVPSPLLYQGLIYYFSVNNATLSIVSASDGEMHVDAERLQGLFNVYASPVAADGRVYILGRDGGVVVLKAGPKIEVLHQYKFPDGFDASPALVDRELFLRGKEHLYCFAAP